MNKKTHTPRWIASLLAGAAMGLAAVTSGVSAQVPESTDPIHLSVHDYVGSEFMSQLALRLLQEAGYNADLVTIDVSSVYTALENADISFQIEAWTSTHPELQPILDAGRVTLVGDTGMMGKDRWWYPDYVKEMCPGLPDYRALNDCAKLFATPETGEKGRFLSYPDDWGGFDEERIANLGLNYEVIHTGSEAALLAEVKAAVQRKAPILTWLYEPHWAPTVFKGEYVQLPPATDECYTSKSYACEKKDGPIVKLAWNGAKEKWPHAYKIIEAYKLDNAEFGKALVDVAMNGKSVADAVDEWMEQNKDRWMGWIK